MAAIKKKKYVDRAAYQVGNVVDAGEWFSIKEFADLDAAVAFCSYLNGGEKPPSDNDGDSWVYG